MVLLIWDSDLPMGIHHCIEKCAVGERYLAHHKACKDSWVLIRPEVTLITFTKLLLEAGVA